MTDDNSDNGTASWRTAYKAKLTQITQDLGIFAMRSNVRIGRPFGIHFFEPRYRWLVTRTMVEGGPGVFIYCVEMPRGDGNGWICEMRNVDQMEDGRADLEV